MIIGYCRISAIEPKSRLDVQKAALSAAGAQVFFAERVGLNSQSPKLEQAIASVQRGDTLVVTRPYRVARSVRGVLSLIDRLGKKGAGLRILGTPIDTATTTGRMIVGSTPLWSLGISPLRAALLDLLTRSRR